MEKARNYDGTFFPFNDEEFDLIWSEGAIYNIGFEKGLNYWNRFLKRGGYIAVTEACWFTETRPEEINSFWNDAYPEIDTISNKVDVMQKAGFIPVATFILGQDCFGLDWMKFLRPTKALFRRNLFLKNILVTKMLKEPS